MLSKIKRRIGIPLEEDKSDLLLMDIIEQAENYVCLYLAIPAIEDVRINSIVQGLSIDLFNKMGEEGKTTSIYSEYRSDFPEDVLAPYINTLNAIKQELASKNEMLIRFI